MPITDQDITFDIGFTAVSNSRTNSRSGVVTITTTGTIVYTGTTDYVGDYGILLSDVTEVVEVTFPDLMTMTFTVTPATNRSGAEDLPTDVNGNAQQGTYSVRVTSTITGGTDPGVYVSDPVPADYCPTVVDLVLTPTVNCVCAELSGLDETSYTALGLTIISRTMTITPPKRAGIWAEFSNAGPLINTAGKALYNNGTYTITNDVVVEDAFNTTYTLSTFVDVDVDCQTVCQMFCALDTMMAKITENTSNPALKAQQLNAFQLATAFAMVASQSQTCASDAMSTYLDAFYNVLKPYGITPECDCNCCDGDDIVQPRCNASGATTYSFFSNPTQYLAVQTSGTAITYSLTASAVALLNAVRVYTFTSPDGSVGITPTISPTPGGNSNFALVALGVRQRLSFKYRVTFNGSIGSASYPTLKRSGAVWTLVNPTAGDAIVGGLYYLTFSGIVNTIPQDLYVDAYISYQEPVKALSNGNAHTNEVLRLTPVADNVNGIIYLKFFDLAGTNPVFRDSPIQSTQIYQYVKTIEITVDIWL